MKVSLVKFHNMIFVGVNIISFERTKLQEWSFNIHNSTLYTRAALSMWWLSSVDYSEVVSSLESILLTQLLSQYLGVLCIECVGPWGRRARGLMAKVFSCYLFNNRSRYRALFSFDDENVGLFYQLEADWLENNRWSFYWSDIVTRFFSASRFSFLNERTNERRTKLQEWSFNIHSSTLYTHRHTSSI